MKMTDLFTKEDARHLKDDLVQLFDAKMLSISERVDGKVDTVNERITGLRNWAIGVGLVATATGLTAGLTGRTPTHAAISLAHYLFS